MKTPIRRWLAGPAVAALGLWLTASLPAAAQFLGEDARFALDARGGVNVPTFDVADVAQAGPSFGTGAVVPLSSRVALRGAFDLGFHPGEERAGGTDLPDVDVYHYVAGVAVSLLPPRERRWWLTANAGVGGMTFAVDGGDSHTYFAVNVGGELGYLVAPRLGLFLSPQGDIAFSDEDELGTGDAWVWPFSAGVRVLF